MKISKRLLFLLWMFVGTSELVAMKTNRLPSIDPELQKELEPLFVQILRIDSNSEEIGRITDLGSLPSKLLGSEKIRAYALLNDNSNLLNDNSNQQYVENVSCRMNNVRVYQVTVVSKQKPQVIGKQIIIDARSFEKPIITPLQEINANQKLKIEELEINGTIVLS